MSEPEALDERQLRAVSCVAGGMSPPQAFRKAGFAPSYARKAATVLKRPAFAAALEQERATLRDQLPYDVPAAVREIDRQIKGALGSKTPNHMAAAKLLELKCKIYGMIREKIEVVTVDLAGAIKRAELRIVNLTPSRHPQAQLNTAPDQPVSS